MAHLIGAVTCRLWFDKRIPMRFPANVLSGFDDTMGSTFFDLNDLQVSTLRVQTASNARIEGPHCLVHMHSA